MQGTQPRQEQTWASAGPVLPDELRLDLQDALTRARALLPLAGAPVRLDYGTAVRSLHQAWACLDSAVEALTPAQGRALLGLLPDLRRLDLRLAHLQLDRSRAANRLLARVLSRLEALPCSVPDLVAAAPELVCELGFDRGLISRVTDGVWIPELMFVMGDPDWAAAILQAGKAEPQVLVPGLYETEMLRTGKPILVTGVQTEPRRGHRAMVEASRTRSYVGAPILSSGGDVVGFLHGDRFGQQRDVDELDRELLATFADALRAVLSRAAVMDAVVAVQRRVVEAAASLEAAQAGVHDLPVLRMDRDPWEDTDGLVVRTGPRLSLTRSLPDNLTRRELEVLGLMAAGRSNQAIAQELFIADGTVKQHVKHILRKLPASSRSEAVTRWFQSGPAGA